MKEFFGSISTQDTSKIEPVITKMTSACRNLLGFIAEHNRNNHSKCELHMRVFLQSLEDSGEYKSSMIAKLKKEMNILLAETKR